MLENMQKDWKVNGLRRDKREVKYIKKFNTKMNILKLILLIIVLIIVSIIGRKMFILGSLKSKLEDRIGANNYNVKFCSYSGDSLIVDDAYVKDGKYLCKSISSPVGYERIEFNDGTKVNYYITASIENDTEKIAILNQDVEQAFSAPLVKIQNYLYTRNAWEFIWMALSSSMKTEQCNGKECYRIKGNGQILYIDKETGLTVRATTTSVTSQGKGMTIDTIFDFFYEFDCVTDSDLVEPDINEYRIQQ